VPRLGAGTGGGERSHINRTPAKKGRKAAGLKENLTHRLARLASEIHPACITRARAMLLSVAISVPVCFSFHASPPLARAGSSGAGPARFSGEIS